MLGQCVNHVNARPRLLHAQLQVEVDPSEEPPYRSSNEAY